MRILLSLYILAISTSASCYAQSMKLFSVDGELSNSLIQDVLQDRYGIIWVATEDGLNRYDGSKFIVYRKNNQDTTSALNNFSRRLFEDSKGNLFVGFINGLQLYDYATGTFKKIPLILPDGSAFSAYVTSIVERKNGDILIGTSGHGLFKLINDSNGFYANQLTGAIPSFLISYLYEDRDLNLWVSTQDMGLLCLKKDQRLKSYFSSEETSRNTISSICEDRAGNLYVGNVSTGLHKYAKTTDSFVSISFQNDSKLAVNTLFLSRSGEIYIGTEGEGMKVYNTEKKQITQGNFNFTTLDFSKSKVKTIMEDKAGNIWLGIYQKGVILSPSNSNNFKYIGYKSIKNNSIGSHSITAVFKDDEGTLWVGTDGDGIYKLGPAGDQKAHFQQTSNSNKDFPMAIFSIFEDSNHEFWIGSYDKGLSKFNPKTGSCENVNYLLRSNDYQAIRVFSIVEDQNKNLWIGTIGSGLFCLNLRTKDAIHYNAVSGLEYRIETDVLHSSWINCLLILPNNKLYIGTVDGFACMDLKTHSFISTYGTNRLLSGQVVYSLYEDSQGILWIGTSDGLKYMDPSSHQILPYAFEHELPGEMICAIKEDNLNNLWISTNSGISKLNLKTKNLINYNAGDGLQGNEFNKGAADVDKNGEMIFGGLNGITLFNPNEITDEGKKLDVYFTGFYIHDQTVKKGMKSGPYDVITSSIMEAETIHLSHKDNSFSIEFSAMEYSNPERIIYMYTLGDTDHWITLHQGANNVTFNNLDPGEYKFKVKAKNYNTYSQPNEISVIIHPAWYLSFWAKSAYFLIFALIAGVMAILVKHRIDARRKLREHMYAEEIKEAKLELFTNISHEIRTPISLITNPLKKLIESDKDAERQKVYCTMHRNSERILNLINQLMDVRRIEKGQLNLKFQDTDIVAFIKDIYNIFEEQAKAKQIDFVFKPVMEQLDVWIDPENFDKIIINILSNAFKFTNNNGEISVFINTGKNDAYPKKLQKYVEIGISDNGIGIEESEAEHIFERFYQVQKKGIKRKEGTGIGLHLSRSLVELHHGIIRFEKNKEGQGCTFIIHLPLGNSHLTLEEIETDTIAISDQDTRHFTDVLTLPQNNLEKKVKSKTNYHVLFVDDNEEIRNFIHQELSPYYHITECSNGKEGLSVALNKKPDVIISDIIMPEMDGITLISKIKENVNINDIPIILLTAKSKEEDKLKGLGIGADAYITKPFNIEIIKKTIDNLIKNRVMLLNKFSGNQQQDHRVQQIKMKSTDEKLMERIMSFINKNISNPELNVEMLANEVGISRVHLHRKLKEITNQSTRDFIRNIRLKQAGNLLSEKQLAISEVAYATGFTNLAYFSNAFKEFYGVSPTAYMETGIEARNQINEKL